VRTRAPDGVEAWTMLCRREERAAAQRRQVVFLERQRVDVRPSNKWGLIWANDDHLQS
jgi:hypothetical protein